MGDSMKDQIIEQLIKRIKDLEGQVKNPNSRGYIDEKESSALNKYKSKVQEQPAKESRFNNVKGGQSSGDIDKKLVGMEKELTSLKQQNKDLLLKVEELTKSLREKEKNEKLKDTRNNNNYNNYRGSSNKVSSLNSEKKDKENLNVPIVKIKDQYNDSDIQLIKEDIQNLDSINKNKNLVNYVDLKKQQNNDDIKSLSKNQKLSDIINSENKSNYNNLNGIDNNINEYNGPQNVENNNGENQGLLTYIPNKNYDPLKDKYRILQMKEKEKEEQKKKK